MQSDVHRKRAVMAELTPKGLGAFNNKLASLLENRVLGFNKINQSWTQTLMKIKPFQHIFKATVLAVLISSSMQSFAQPTDEVVAIVDSSVILKVI